MTSSTSKLLELKRRQLELLKLKVKQEKDLPHIYFPMYKWQREIHESTNRVNLLTAANQIGKSSALIRRAIANCTDPARWQKMWGLKGDKKPAQFWYFYPDSNTVEKEIDTKWKPEWLPRGTMESHPQYGWRLKKKNGIYTSCEFNAGPIIYFQMYTKSLASVQAGSVYEILADEELPMEFYSELMFRLTATSGIFTSGFTPTLNQFFWKQAMETTKVLPSAKKLTVSMYDCLKYEDGTPSKHITLEKIKLAEERCKNETERQRRIFGKFVTEEGRSYYAFDYDKNVCAPYSIEGWDIYAAVDYGSGDDPSMQKKTKSAKNHPSAITFIAVRPDFRKGAIFKSWRGDHEKTTAGDVFNKYQELARGLRITKRCYDPGAPDFGTTAERNSTPFEKANKSRDLGEDLLNTLFKYNMLDIFDDDPENLKLASELMTLMISKQTSDHKKDDDLTDSARYNVMQIPWDLSAVGENTKEFIKQVETRPLTEAEHQAIQIKLRRGEDVPFQGDQPEKGWNELESEFEEWNQEYGN